MLSRKKQLAINLLITTFFVTASVGVGCANSGGNVDSNGNYIGNNGTASNNTVQVDTVDVNKSVYGGKSNNGDATGNSVTISGGTIAENVYGVYSYTNTGNPGNLTDNSVTISGGTIKGYVSGGYSGNIDDVERSSVIISDGTIGGDVYGGYSADAGNLTDNSVTISGGTITGNVYGGKGNSNGQTTESSVTVSDGTISGNVYGGYSWNSSATNNKVTVSGGTIGKDVYGGYSGNGGSLTDNSVTISDGTISGNVYGGKGDYNNNVERNSVIISGGTIAKSVYGGRGNNVERNSVIISGGEVKGFAVYGGYSDSGGSATNNTVTIKGNPTFSASTILYGGYSSASGGDALTGNKLEVYRYTNNAIGAHELGGVENFEKMNFYLGNTTKNGDIMLKLANEVKLDKTDIGVDIVAGEKPNLVVGDKVTLIESDVSFSTTPKSQTAYAGIEKIYGLDFFKEAKALGVTINKIKDNSKVQSIPVAQMTGQSMLRMGSDTISNQGMTAALTATKIEQVENPNDGEGGMPSLSTEKSFLNKGAVFATIGGGTSKYKTGGTSDVNSYNVMTGMAWRINQPKNNNLILGAFFESGWGNYTTNNSFADGNVRGDGSSDYMGGGILGRYEFASGTYVEGSVRMGQVKNDYHSDDLRGAGDARVGYNTSDTYTGAHLGLGYIKKINDQAELDLYGKYLYTHQEGSSVTMVGDNISFDPTNSHRLRLGARLAQKTTKDFNGYVGLAYEYEFDGKMGSSINHNPILAPSVKGSSGILELGVIFKPTNNKNLSLDLSVNGYAGKREGVSGNLQLKYLF